MSSHNYTVQFSQKSIGNCRNPKFKFYLKLVRYSVALQDDQISDLNYNIWTKKTLENILFKYISASC